jgi:LysM repeat protein
MTRNPEDKIIKARIIKIISYVVIGVLCIVMVFSAIAIHENSLKIDEIREIKNDITLIKESMVIIGEKAGMTSGELDVLDLHLQSTQARENQSIKRKVYSREKGVTGSTMESSSIPGEGLEPSTASLLREKLKSYGGRLVKREGSPELKMVEEVTEPVPAKVPEDLQRPKVTNISEKIQKSKSNIKTIPKYHIVQKGETLSHIAKKYNISIKELGKLNNIDLKQLIYPGQKLIITKGNKK